MRGGKAFFDTNVLIYAFAKDDPRTQVAERLLAGGGVIGVQILNEFASVALRKLSMGWNEAIEALSAIRLLCEPPVPLTLAIHDKALQIAQRHRYNIYDALVVAAALEASCSTLYSEDMHDGQIIEGLTIQNPFRRS